MSDGGGPSGPCSTPVASTATRPQLSDAQAANYTVAKYLANGTDNWSPTAVLGAMNAIAPAFTVAKDGSGSHTTVQAALSAATGSSRQYILVKPGEYRETVTYQGATPVTLYGTDSDASKVVIVGNKSSGTAGGTGASATFTVKSAAFQVANLTISNDFATPASGSDLQAVALYTTSDKIFWRTCACTAFKTRSISIRHPPRRSRGCTSRIASSRGTPTSSSGAPPR